MTHALLLWISLLATISPGLMAISPGQVFASSFVERPFPDTVQDSPTIVRGKIGMKYAKNSNGSDGRSRIYTYYEFQVEEVFKGKGIAESHQIMVREIGGEKDGVGLQVAGAAQFERGEDVVILLSRANSDDSFDVQGLMMGKYNIEKDSEGREYLAGAGVSSLTQPALRGHEQLFQSGNQKTPTRWGLVDLRKLVQEQESKSPQAEASNKVEKPAVSLISKASSAVPATFSPEPSKQPALQLQTHDEGEPSSPRSFGIWVVGGFAVLLIIAVLILRKN